LWIAIASGNATSAARETPQKFAPTEISGEVSQAQIKSASGQSLLGLGQAIQEGKKWQNFAQTEKEPMIFKDETYL
jgi:hypothetical protein